jgi:hypothetical protein
MGKMLSIERVFRNQRISQALIGMSRGEFELLLFPFMQAYAISESEHKINFVRGRKSILEQVEEKLFFILFYLKTYPTFDVLGILFEMDRTTACKQSHLLMNVLKDALSMLDVLPSRTKAILKRRLKKLNTGSYVIADGTERPIRRPKNKDNQKEFYSGKKKRHTHKNLILTNNEKAILFLSETISGKTHDITIARDTDFISSIPKDISCLMDNGFEGIEKDYPKANIVKPKKKPKGKELKAIEKKKNKLISKKRVLIENAIAGVKRFRITTDVFRNTKFGFSELVFWISCGLWNLHLGFKNSILK